MVRGIQIMQKFWILTFSARRARGHVRMQNFEMLKMTWNVLSID